MNEMINRRDPYPLGLLLSISSHILLCIFIYVTTLNSHDISEESIVYSVSLEGGKTIGGISQVAKETTKTPPAPPKPVSEPETKNSEVHEETKSKPETPVVAPPDAEVSTAEARPTPSIKPAPTPSPRASAQATPAPAPKSTKATPKPSAAAKSPDIEKSYQQALQRYLGESTDAHGKGFGAAKLGGSAMGGGVVRPPEFFEYYERLKRHIKAGWRWYDTAAPLTCKIAFEISAEGQLSGIRVMRGSGNGDFDDSVYRAVAKANPVPPPPSKVYEWFKSVSIEFDPRE